jgi:hypothetical protein
VVDLGEFIVGAVEADLESFDLAEPALALGLSDAGDEIVADFRDARPAYPECDCSSSAFPKARSSRTGCILTCGSAPGS